MAGVADVEAERHAGIHAPREHVVDVRLGELT
jgi:hypothetical protein